MKTASRKTMSLNRVNPMKSVGLKLFLIILVSSIVFVFGIGFYSYFQSKAIIQDQAENANYQTIVQAREKLDIILKKYEELSLQLTLNKDVQAQLAESSAADASDYERFAAARKVTDMLSSFSITDAAISAMSLIPIDPNGQLFTTNATDVKLDKTIKEAWFLNTQQAAGKVIYVPTQSTRILGSGKGNTFGIARIYKDILRNKTTHIMLIELKLDIFDTNMQMDLGSQSDVMLLSADNQIVYSKQAELIGTKSDLVLPSMEEGANGTSSTIHAVDGGDKMVSFSPLTASGWSLVSVVPVDMLVQKAKYIFNVTLMGAGIVALVAAFIGFWVVRMIGRPLIQLRNLMNEGANGNLSVRTKYQSQDEIGQLSSGFNEMMDQITLLVQQTNDSAIEVLQTASELSEASQKTATSAKEIAVATEEIAKGAANLAVEAEQGNDLTISIGAHMTKVVEANDQMGSSAAEVEKVSGNGMEHLRVMTEKNSLTEEMVHSLVQKVNTLKDSTNSIRKILDVLSNMTKQTNILSLNATIEASRAGAAGKGFMVVADEIRKLADESRHSIHIVAEITEKISGEIVETVHVLSTAAPIFQEQIQSVHEVNRIFGDVQQHMEGFIQQLNETTDSIQNLDQSQVRLAEAMSNVSSVAEESSATSEEVASLSNEQQSVSTNLIELSAKLEQVSGRLKETLTRFKM